MKGRKITFIMKIIGIFLLIFACFAFGFGQVKTISENEFKAIYDKWSLLSKNETYRIKMTSESKLNGSPSNHNQQSINEYAPPDKKRFVSILKTPRLNTKIETIHIGEKKYTRKDDGEWREVTTKANAPSKNDRIIFVESNEYKYLGREIINGQKAEVYERITKHRINNEKTSSESYSTIKTKYWFDKNGLLLKMMNEMELISGIMTSVSTNIYDYEYDPKIKIEAPIK